MTQTAHPLAGAFAAREDGDRAQWDLYVRVQQADALGRSLGEVRGNERPNLAAGSGRAAFHVGR